jgi:hypothetical protein
MNAEPLTPETRRKLLEFTSETISVTGELFQTCVELRSRLRQARAETEYGILNAHELVLLVQFDVACLLNDLVTHNGTKRAQFYARLLILTLRESAGVLPGVLNHRFRADLVERLGAHLDSPLKHAHSLLSALFRDVETQFGDVRDGIVAHIDRDAERRVILLNRVNPEKVAKLTIDLMRALHILGPCFLAYMQMLRSRHVQE